MFAGRDIDQVSPRLGYSIRLAGGNPSIAVFCGGHNPLDTVRDLPQVYSIGTTRPHEFNQNLRLDHPSAKTEKEAAIPAGDCSPLDRKHSAKF
jgi:hypothetical protein